MEGARETVDPNFPIFREAQSSQVRQRVREGKSGGPSRIRVPSLEFFPLHSVEVMVSFS